MATGTQELVNHFRSDGGVALSPGEAAPPPVLTPSPGRPSGTDATEMLRLRRAAPALLLLVVAVVLSLVGLRMGDMAAPHADVTLLPTAFGAWVMTGSEKTNPKLLALDDATAQSLSLDSYTNRNYVNRVTGQQVQMLVEYRRLGRGSFNHRPEACYPAYGYTLTGRTTTPIVYGGQPAQAITLVADSQGEHGRDHQVLLHWFATGSRVESSFLKQQVEMAFGRLQPDKNGWAWVRVISECQPDPRDNAEALAAEKDFVRQASPSLIRVISTSVGK